MCVKCSIFAAPSTEKSDERTADKAFCITPGEVHEWLKWHAWKACVPLKGTGGSNPFLSAFARQSLFLDDGGLFFCYKPHILPKLP